MLGPGLTSGWVRILLRLFPFSFPRIFPSLHCALFYPSLVPIIFFFLINCTSRKTSLVVQMVKNPPANAGGTGDAGLIPGLGRSPGGGNSRNPVQYSCLENSMDRGAWQAVVCGVAESWIQLNNWAHTYFWYSFSNFSPCYNPQRFRFSMSGGETMYQWVFKTPGWLWCTWLAHRLFDNTVLRWLPSPCSTQLIAALDSSAFLLRVSLQFSLHLTCLLCWFLLLGLTSKLGSSPLTFLCATVQVLWLLTSSSKSIPDNVQPLTPQGK